MAIPWSSEYETGHSQIDSHHKRLFQYLADLEEVSRQYDPAKAAALVKFLDLYIQQHFNYEEICMHQLRCPAAQQNADAHAKFKQAYADFSRRFTESRGDFRLFSELRAMVEMWISNHVARVDSQLRPCLNK